MPGQNDFKAFAAGGGANALTPAAYSALTSLLANGFQAGTASSAQINTVLRQVTSMAAALGKIISDADLDAVDDGNVSALAAALLSSFADTFDPVERIKVVGTLGDGSGSPFRPNINACIEFSSGHMLQVGGGFAPAAAGVTGTLISFPVAFEEACYQVIATDYGAGIPVLGVSTVDGNLAQFRAWAKDGTVGSYQNAYFRYLAFGK